MAQTNAHDIADTIIDEVRSGRIEAEYEAVLEAIDQAVDNRCIYTPTCLEIMQETDNADAYVEDFGSGDLVGEDWSGIVSKFAWAALRRDVTDYLFRIGCDPNKPENWGFKAEWGVPNEDDDVETWNEIDATVYHDQVDAEEVARDYQDNWTGDGPVSVRVVNLAGDAV